MPSAALLAESAADFAADVPFSTRLPRALPTFLSPASNNSTPAPITIVASGLDVARSTAARASAVLPSLAKVMAPLVMAVVVTLCRSSSKAVERPARAMLASSCKRALDVMRASPSLGGCHAAIRGSSGLARAHRHLPAADKHKDDPDHDRHACHK